MNLLLVLLAFLSGSIPYSVLVGKVFLKRDIRAYGDGNPGAYNVFRAGGRLSGALAAALDVLKGTLPVWWGRLHVPPAVLPWLAVAPVLGHAFSPWLRFRGGKSVAVTYGIWLGLTGWLVSLRLAAGMLFFFLLLNEHAWVVVLGTLSLSGFLLRLNAPPTWWTVWALSSLILVWKHRHDLDGRPTLRAWLHRRIFARP